jgi:hypothetical protein
MTDTSDVEFLRWYETADRSVLTPAERLAVGARLQLVAARTSLMVMKWQAEVIRGYEVPALGVTCRYLAETYLREVADPAAGVRDLYEAFEFGRRPLLSRSVSEGRVPLHLARAFVRAGPGLRGWLEAGLILSRRPVGPAPPRVVLPGASRHRTAGRRVARGRAA